jgi:hypothetical protein
VLELYSGVPSSFIPGIPIKIIFLGQKLLPPVIINRLELSVFPKTPFQHFGAPKRPKLHSRGQTSLLHGITDTKI